MANRHRWKKAMPQKCDSCNGIRAHHSRPAYKGKGVVSRCDHCGACQQATAAA